MLLIKNNNNTKPQINHAIELFLLRNMQIDEVILFLYVNEPTVLVGRHQNTIEEIDLDYTRAANIHVIRRVTGGGAVYHDEGNLNFCFIAKDVDGYGDSFQRFITPVIGALGQLGIYAECRERSSIFVDNKKISGNAQYREAGRILSHGSLLFNLNLEHMLQALNPRQVKIESEAVQSVRRFVTNISERLPQPMTLASFKDALLKEIFLVDDLADVPCLTLTDANWQAIEEIAVETFDNWEWNYGRSPQFNLQKSGRFDIGTVDVRLNVEQGIIQEAKIYGNFIGDDDVAKLEALLSGVRHMPDALAAAIADVDLTPFFGEISKADFLDLLY